MLINDIDYKVPLEESDYKENSDYVVQTIEQILKDRFSEQEDGNKIKLNTNLKLGLPLENINKIAGPMIEAWAQEVFTDVFEDSDNPYKLINVEPMARLEMADILLQFRKDNTVITANSDVKATSDDIITSGKSPNITSFRRIRTAYIDDPDYMFIILSLKHKVYSEKNGDTFMMDGVMEITKYNAYDLKYISENDLNYNPALGTGQIQIKDIHYVDLVNRTTWEFCQLLDKKYLNSSQKNIDLWLIEARKCGWIKN